MIGKEEFIELVKHHEEQNKRVDKICEIFPNFFEIDVIDESFRLYDIIFNITFDKEGIEWINAYLYESCREYYMDDIKHKLESIDDLWNLVKPHRK